MQPSRIGLARFAALTMIAAAIVSPAQGAGFSFYEQGSKAMGMANAFTAQADDPSALFFNVGGLAFLDERDFYAGVTVVSLGDSTFYGADPTPGLGAPGNQTSDLRFPFHFYWIEPVSDRLSFGLSLTSPFGLATQWDDPVALDPDTLQPIRWSGRYISQSAEIRTYDLTPNIGFRITDRLGIGVGVIARFSTVELHRLIDGNAVDGSIPAGTDVGRSVLESDPSTGFGFNFGILHRVCDYFSWGLSYRSKITVDYSGDADLTQILTGNPAIDDPVATALPFGQNLPLDTSIEFPDQASLGLAFRFDPRWLLEVDFNWTGWSSFDELNIEVQPPNESLSETRPQLWDDAINVRAGVRWDRNAKSHWRFGIYWDESPQPEETVSPTLPDADRLGGTVGYGLGTKRFDFDIAVMYVDFEERTTLSNVDNFLGSYRTGNLLLGTSFRW
jgi:long-chain fatty acid transport protein